MVKYITTSLKSSELDIINAKNLAEEYSLKYFDRENYSTEKLFQKYNCNSFFIMKHNQLIVINERGEDLFFHPGTGLIRTKMLEKGEKDILIKALGISPEDSVLDCTGGLCNDSIVISYYLESGCITTFEKSKDLFLIAKYGLSNYFIGSNKFQKALKKIKLYNIDFNLFFNSNFYQDYNINKNFDSIFFDPMFDNPILESSGISKIRDYASYDILKKSTLNKALEIARKRVVVKIRNNDSFFVNAMNPKEILGNSKNSVRYAIFEK